MGFYRIIKKTIRFILYQLPKKWLIMIIFALAMTFGLTQVKGYTFTNTTQIDTDVSINTLTFYDEIMFKTQIVTDIPFTRYNNLDFSVRYIRLPQYSIPLGMGDNAYSNELWGTKPNMLYLINPNVSGDKYTRLYIANSSVGNFPIPESVAQYDTNVTINYFLRSVTNNDASVNTTARYWASFMSEEAPIDVFTFTNNLINLTNEPLVYGVYAPDTYYFRFLIITGDSSHLLYPAKIDNKVGMYDVATKKLYYITDSSKYLLGNITQAPDVPEEPSEPTTPDYSEDFNQVNENLENINNSITDLNNSQQETNDFLKDTNVNSNNKNLPSPTIENSQVISQVDNAYSDFFEDYLLLFASELPIVIELYIPNMSTGGIASTIRIPSTYVKEHLSSLSIPFINYSMLELVHMVWYVLFAFWFLGFATNLVTILYSGEIMQDKGLSKLTKTYTGVSKNML